MRWNEENYSTRDVLAMSHGESYSRQWEDKACKMGDISYTAVSVSASGGIPRPTNGNLTPSTVSVDIRATLWPLTLMHGLPFISCCHIGAAIRAPFSPPGIIALARSLEHAFGRPRESHGIYTKGGPRPLPPPGGFNYELIVMYRAAANSAR